MKNLIFDAERKVAEDEYVEGYCTNHPMKDMGDFQAWYLGSQPMIATSMITFLESPGCFFAPS